jgi:hypothetical protein
MLEVMIGTILVYAMLAVVIGVVALVRPGKTVKGDNMLLFMHIAGWLVVLLFILWLVFDLGS